MTADELYHLYESMPEPEVIVHSSMGIYTFRIRADTVHLNEPEAALLIARLFAALPERTATEAVAVGEMMIRREREEGQEETWQPNEAEIRWLATGE